MSTDTELMAEQVFQAVKHYIDQREASFNRRLESLDQRFAVLEAFGADQVSRAMRNELLAG